MAELKLTLAQKQALVDYFQPYLTPERQAVIESVLRQRTRYLTVVLEDFYLTQNANAVLRTAESLGLQDLHIIENVNPFRINRDVTRGCNKWLTLHQYCDGQHFLREGESIVQLEVCKAKLKFDLRQDHRPNPATNTAICLDFLKQQGYRLIATSPHGKAIAPEELPLTEKVALLMGNEQNGLSNYALEQAEGTLIIPMVGVSESFNVSVSAAICLYSLTRRLRQTDLAWPLSEIEKLSLRLRWYRQSARSSAQLEKRFLQEQGWLQS